MTHGVFRGKRTKPSQQPLGYFLKQARHALRTRMNAALRPLGLTTPQYAVLAAIEREPGISSASLARTAFVTAQTMQGIVANLEREGLLQRRADPTHGRILRSELTKQGREVVAHAHKIADEIDTVMTASLSAEDRVYLANLLSRCATDLIAKEIEYNLANSLAVESVVLGGAKVSENGRRYLMNPQKSVKLPTP